MLWSLYPRYEITHEHAQQTLSQLNMCPSAVIFVLPPSNQPSSNQVIGYFCSANSHFAVRTCLPKPKIIKSENTLTEISMLSMLILFKLRWDQTVVGWYTNYF